MANKKKIFDRLDNLNISNNYKNEIFNLIEDIEINIGNGLKYENDELVVSIGTASRITGSNDRSGLITEYSSKEKKDYIKVNVGDGLEIDADNRLNVIGAKIPEVIDKEIYYNDGSNEVVPVRWPDLSTQPSILPYKFMGQYVYEQLIHRGDFDYGKLKGDYFGQNPYEMLFIDVAPVIAATTSNSVVFSFLWTGNDGFQLMASGSPVYLVEHQYIRVVYTLRPKENSEYYYNSINSGILLKLPISAPSFKSCTIYNGEELINSIKCTEGLYFNIPNDYKTTLGTILAIVFNSNTYILKTAIYDIPSINETGEVYVEEGNMYLSDILDKAKDTLIIITASE